MGAIKCRKCGVVRSHYRRRLHGLLRELRCQSLAGNPGSYTTCGGRFKRLPVDRKPRGTLLKDVSPAHLLVLCDKLEEGGRTPHADPVALGLGGLCYLKWMSLEQAEALASRLPHVKGARRAGPAWEHPPRWKDVNLYETTFLDALLAECGVSTPRKYYRSAAPGAEKGAKPHARLYPAEPESLSKE